MTNPKLNQNCGPALHCAMLVYLEKSCSMLNAKYVVPYSLKLCNSVVLTHCNSENKTLGKELDSLAALCKFRVGGRYIRI